MGIGYDLLDVIALLDVTIPATLPSCNVQSSQIARSTVNNNRISPLKNNMDAYVVSRPQKTIPCYTQCLCVLFIRFASYLVLTVFICVKLGNSVSFMRSLVIIRLFYPLN